MGTLCDGASRPWHCCDMALPRVGGDAEARHERGKLRQNECCVGSVAVAVNGPTHCPRVERHLQHLAPQHEVDQNEPLELIVAHVTV